MGCSNSSQKMKKQVALPIETRTPDLKQSRTIDSNRRRLSVSHVGQKSVEEDPHAPAERGLLLSMESKLFNSDEDVPARQQPQQVHWAEATPANATPRARRLSILMGKPAEDMQKGFENKILETEGPATLTQTMLNMEGVGYSCKKGLKPESPNQDDFFVCRVDDWAMYGVFDGHGPSGHYISDYVHRKLPRLIVKHPSFKTQITHALKGAFINTHQMLEEEANESESCFDCTLSGTTATVVVHKEDTLYVAHVGDSRVVVGKMGKGKKVVGRSLTKDHKPTDEREKKRIYEAGGEVLKLEGDIPHRVFVKGKLYPGLAMSRAIGDSIGGTIGVIPEPDVREYKIEGDDAFVIIATDGVWEFINNQEAAEIIAKQGRENVQEATESLAYEAWQRWVMEEETVVDDITVTAVWF